MTFKERLADFTGKPDIIIILTDQERATQHFPDNWEQDNLHSLTFLKDRGFSFDRAFCNTCMCSPSRATLLTGTYPAQHNVTQTLTEGGAYSPAEVQLDNSISNIARMLIDTGYDVQYRGKWHLSKSPDGGKPDAANIALYGFKGWVGPDSGEDAAPENFGGGFANHDKAYVQQAIDYLRDVKKRRANGIEQPYCLVLSLVNPHDVLCYPRGFNYGYNENFLNGPIGLPETVNEDLLTNNKPMAQVQTATTAGILLGALNSDQKKLNYINFYGNMLRWVDAEIGHFLKELYAEADGMTLANQAVVIRIADHGEMGMAHSGMRQKAFVAYEEALRVPMVISNPVLFPQNENDYKSTMNLASLVDLMPTIATLTGATPPSGLRGVDLTPLLNKDNPVQDAILFTFDDTKAGSPTSASVVKAANRLRSVRTTDWKFTWYFDALGGYPDEFELYYIDPNDPDADTIEYNNLAYNPDYADKRKEMTELLHSLMQEKLFIKPKVFDAENFRDWFRAQTARMVS